MIRNTLFGLQICVVRENYRTQIARIGRIITDLNFVLSVVICTIRAIRVPFLVVVSLHYVLRAIEEVILPKTLSCDHSEATYVFLSQTTPEPVGLL